tara:strand:- start:508 stop:885 length:378 start_codon:yes stop_codon:yes gene_type:complete
MTCSCAGKRSKRRIKNYRRNSIVPNEQEPPKVGCREVNAEFMNNFVKEAMVCGYCENIFNINSGELKVHCNICNKFFHCGIAGECLGQECAVTDEYGNIHRARYCIGCVSKIYDNQTCLCKDCSK